MTFLREQGVFSLVLFISAFLCDIYSIKKIAHHSYINKLASVCAVGNKVGI